MTKSEQILDNQLTKMGSAGEKFGTLLRWCGKNIITLVLGGILLVILGVICFLSGAISGLRRRSNSSFL